MVRIRPASFEAPNPIILPAMTSLRPFAIVLLLGLVLQACQSVEPIVHQLQPGFHERSLTHEGETRLYQIYVPPGYTDRQSWPVVMFLHGAGERGSDGLLQTQVGLGPAMRTYPERFPVIGIFPQLPNDTSWRPDTESIALTALQQTIQELSVDQDRIVLTGLSMGGHGSLYLGTRHTSLFAGIAPVCPTVGDNGGYPYLGGSSYEESIAAAASALSDVPVWLFHGDEDQIFSAQISRDLTRALQEAEGDVRYTEFQGVGHNSWDPAYSMLDFSEWVLMNRRPEPESDPAQ